MKLFYVSIMKKIILLFILTLSSAYILYAMLLWFSTFNNDFDYLSKKPYKQNQQESIVNYHITPYSSNSSQNTPDKTKKSTKTDTLFIGNITSIPNFALDSIKKYTWNEDCPIHHSQLSWITLSYWDFDGNIKHDGVIIIHKAHANDIFNTFKDLFADKAPFTSIRPAFEFKGNDDTSMRANNTVAFACRKKNGQPGVFSNHSFGTAIDINPIQNPFVKRGVVSPIEGEEFADRDNIRAGMILYNNAYYNSFKSRGWFWGGHWKNSKDYQHFEKAIGGSDVGSDRGKVVPVKENDFEKHSP